MAIEMMKDFEIFDGVLNGGRWSDLHIYMVDNEDMRDRFLERVVEENTKNKSKLRDLLGGKKLYTLVKETRASVNFDKIKEIIYNEIKDKRIKLRLGDATWHIENRKIDNAVEELYRFGTLLGYAFSSGAREEEIIAVLKEEYFYNENITKMRNIPKLTRLFKMIYDGVIDRWKITENYEPVVAKIMDELGRKPKNYILELSTDAIDILTCSVSNNFTSCFNISKGGCNLASTNYLAIDRTTAILKLYELNDENVKRMELGNLDYSQSVARTFVSFDVDDNKRMVIGRLYPDNKILDYDSLKTILFPLLKCKDDSKGEWVEDMLINYGNNYVGYADYNESWNMGYMATSNCKKLNVGDMGMVFYNKFTDTFDVSDRYYLQTGYMYSLTNMSQNKLERDWAIKECDEDKEECESSIDGTRFAYAYSTTYDLDTTNNISSMIARVRENILVDDTPFYTIPDTQTISISGIATTAIATTTDYITELTAEPPNRIQIQAENAYESWVQSSTLNNND